MSEEQNGFSVRDSRRIDPETGEVRPDAAADDTAAAGAMPTSHAAPGAAPQSSGQGGGAASDGTLKAELDERTADLLRVKAEYDNYRKRVARDREATQEQALANVVTQLLPVLDDIDRARTHGELEGGFRQVGEGIEALATKFGAVKFGEVGDEFDPVIHEAMMHRYEEGLTAPTCVEIFQHGYRLGERVLRPARVVVAEPADPSAAGAAPAEPSPEAADTSGSGAGETGQGNQQESS